MINDAFGRFVSGVLWGLGGGLAVTTAGDSGLGMRGVAKRLIKSYLMVADLVLELAVEPHESLEVLGAETRKERGAATRTTSPAAASAGARGRARSPSRESNRAP